MNNDETPFEEQLDGEEGSDNYTVHYRIECDDSMITEVVRAAISGPSVQKITHSPTNGRAFRDKLYRCVVAANAPTHYTIGRVLNRASGKPLTRQQQLELLETDLKTMDLTGVPVDSCHHEKHIVGEILADRWHQPSRSKWASFKLYQDEKGDRRPGQIEEAIRAGKLNGVSLAHYEIRRASRDVVPAVIKPFSLAICRVGARPGTRIHFGKKSDTPFADCILASGNVSQSSHTASDSCTCDSCQVVRSMASSSSLAAAADPVQGSAPSGPAPVGSSSVPAALASSSIVSAPAGEGKLPSNPTPADIVRGSEGGQVKTPSARMSTPAAAVPQTFSGGLVGRPDIPGAPSTATIIESSGSVTGGTSASAPASTSAPAAQHSDTPSQDKAKRSSKQILHDLIDCPDIDDTEKRRLVARLLGGGTDADDEKTPQSQPTHGRVKPSPSQQQRANNKGRPGAAAAAASAAAQEPSDMDTGDDIETLNEENATIIEREARGLPHEDLKRPVAIPIHRNSKGQFLPNRSAPKEDKDGDADMDDAHPSAAPTKTPQQSMDRLRRERALAEQKAKSKPPVPIRASASAGGQSREGVTTAIRASQHRTRDEGMGYSPSDLYGPNCRDGDAPFTTERCMAYFYQKAKELQQDAPLTKRRGANTHPNPDTTIIRASEGSGFAEDIELSPAQQAELDQTVADANRLKTVEDLIRASEGQSLFDQFSTASASAGSNSKPRGLRSVVFADVKSTPEGEKIFGNKTFSVSLPMINILNTIARQNNDY